jgi:vitamin B12 transporter
VGQGFKTATISQVACDFCFPPGPSVGLKPERSEGWDVGLLWRPYGAIVLARVTVFGLDVRDQISFGTGRYVNLERTRSRGVEASLEARPFASLTLTATYAYVDAEDRSTGEQLLRVPRHSGSASLSWDPGRYSLTLSLRAESSQADSDPSTFAPARRPGFVTADLAGAYRLTDAVELTARIENLADRRYQDALGYGEPGRALYVGVRVSR